MPPTASRADEGDVVDAADAGEEDVRLAALVVVGVLKAVEVHVHLERGLGHEVLLLHLRQGSPETHDYAFLGTTSVQCLALEQLQASRAVAREVG